MQLQETIRSFGDWLYQLGYSEGTQHLLPALVREFITQQQLTDIRYVEQEQVKAFYAYLQTRPLKKRAGGALSEAMIYHYVYALKTFFSWLEITGQLDYNPVSGLKFKRPTINQRQPLLVADIQELFAACRTQKETAVLHVFYSCGLRRSEGEALNTGDLHYRERLLYVRAGKGARWRVVPMPVAVSVALERYYLEERCHSIIKRTTEQEAFFLNRIGNRMQGDQLNELLKRLLARTTVSKDTTLHHLRHSIATHLLQGGMGIEWVRDFLGHTWLETTQVYAKPTPEQLQLL